MNDPTKRLVRSLIGIIVMVILLIVVNNWWGDYKDAASRLPDAPATSTVDATKTAPATGSPSVARKTVLVLIDGLNFRKKPETGSATIRGLKKGEKLTLVKAQEDWYQVRDSDGAVGWVAAKPQYVRLEK